MFTNRLSSLILAAFLLLGVALAVQKTLVTKAIVPGTNGVYTESNEQAIREYQLGERYGETPQRTAQFSVEQIRREYILGERYGVTPEQFAAEQAHREYWLGERYGQMP